MKLYGYSTKECRTSEAASLLTMAEVTLCATPEELRSIGRFLSACADEMLRMGKAYDHIHLADRKSEFLLSPQFIVAAADPS